MTHLLEKAQVILNDVDRTSTRFDIARNALYNEIVEYVADHPESSAVGWFEPVYTLSKVVSIMDARIRGERDELLERGMQTVEDVDEYFRLDAWLDRPRSLIGG